MGVKFGRNYILSVETNDGDYVTIQPPFTVEFDIVRNCLTSANTCSITVYNLSQKLRKSIQKNQCDWGNIRRVFFKAGYGENIPMCFAGNIIKCASGRSGVDYLTTIEAFDGGFAFLNNRASIQIPTGSTVKDAIEQVVKNMTGVSVGAIGSVGDRKYTRDNTFNGSALQVLADIAGTSIFIDNGKLYVLADNECIDPSGVTKLNAEVGLLQTPTLEQNNMRLEVLFEPSLVIKQAIDVESVTEPFMNGTYCLVALHHKGIISEAVCGAATTTVELFAPMVGVLNTVHGS